MSLRIHRFPLSHFSEKGRALLDFKQLDYEVVEHQLGVPQVGIFRMSGQRQVPVLDHDGTIVPDSTEIAHYLEKTFPDGRALLAEDEATRKDALELEERIDRVFGFSAVVVWFTWATNNDPKIGDWLSLETWGLPPVGGKLLAAGFRRVQNVGSIHRTYEKALDRTKSLLDELCERLEQHPYLTGHTPGLADVAAAGLAFHLKFPQSRHLVPPELAGQGVPLLVEDPVYARFFDWRDQFYSDYLS
jgi:glutathione S-transferase